MASGGSRRRASRQSIKRARTDTATKTTAAITARCQNGMAGSFDTRPRLPQPRPGTGRLFERQGAPAGEAVLESVPVPDLVLAEVPAEEHLLAAAKRREVDQPGVEILHLRTELLDAVDALGDPVGRGAYLLLDRRELRRLDPAAVAADARGDPLLPLLRRNELAPPLDHLLDERPDLRERGVRLLRCEVRRHKRTL